MSYDLSLEQKQHAIQLTAMALLDAMNFIADRLQDSNLESYELVGFTDALFTLMHYGGFTLKSTMATDTEQELFLNGESIGKYPSRFHAWRAMMERIIDSGEVL